MSGAPTSHLLPTFARVDLAFERGEGVWLTATNGERYLDFAAGVAVNALGHAHPQLIEALTRQAQKVWHVSNLYRIPEQDRLGPRLVDNSFADTAFFANSGAEAVECAMKIVRKYHDDNGNPDRYRVITFSGSLEMRTPGQRDRSAAAPDSAEFNRWVGAIFYLPAVAGGLFGMLGGYLTDRLGRRRVLVLPRGGRGRLPGRRLAPGLCHRAPLLRRVPAVQAALLADVLKDAC